MLSILIPIYNFNVVQLVTDLCEQAESCAIRYEVLCFDDCSAPLIKEQNRKIEGLKHVQYKELQENQGRSKIRNQMAEHSTFDNLLFLDCDAALPSSDFIKKYIIHIENYHVVYGGRVYAQYPPHGKEKYFRWYYGKKRESIPVDYRIRRPYKSFMTNNFLIRKKAYLSIKLNESIIGYGHEDTLFGIRLKENSVLVKHINNPVVHIGLEDFDEYISKTNEGMKNLLFISHVVDIRRSVRLYRFLQYVLKYKLDKVIGRTCLKFERQILANLAGNRPILLFFDFYKLGKLVQLYHMKLREQPK